MGLNTSSAVSGFFPTQELVSLIFHGTEVPVVSRGCFKTRTYETTLEEYYNCYKYTNSRTKGKEFLRQEIHNGSSEIRFTRETQILPASKT